MSRLVVRPSAELDILDATDWYEDEEIGLGGQFVDELRHILRRISELPSQFPDVGRGLGARCSSDSPTPSTSCSVVKETTERWSSLPYSISGAARLFGGHAFETKVKRANMAGEGEHSSGRTALRDAGHDGEPGENLRMLLVEGVMNS